MLTTYLTRVRNARQLVMIVNNGEKFLRGNEMNKIKIIENGGMIINHSGRIVIVDEEENVKKLYPDNENTFQNDIDATDRVILPGLIDGHTHPVWSGDRVNEFAMKLDGATYMDIHKIGGGINFTVRHTEESKEDELLNLFLERLDRMLKMGTMLIEAKSGYGLKWDTELKMLKVLHHANKVHAIDIVSNYCAAHSVPKGMTAQEATKDIIENQLPALKQCINDGIISPTLIDVFCEKGVFELEDSENILKAGKEIANLNSNFHGDELNPLKSAEMAGRIKATAVSHLEHISDEGIKAMVENDVVGVLLPTTAYILRIEPPPARKMIDANMIVALGSDFNPNAHCLSLPHVMNLACVLMHMTMEESLVACTINAAASMNRSDDHGSLEKGKMGDFLILNAPSWQHIIYQMVDPPIESVYKRGSRVC